MQAKESMEVPEYGLGGSWGHHSSVLWRRSWWDLHWQPAWPCPCVVELKAETVAAFTHSTVIFTCMCINSLYLTWQGAWRGPPATSYVCSFLRQFLFISAWQEFSPPIQKSEPSRFVVEWQSLCVFTVACSFLGMPIMSLNSATERVPSVTDVPCK